jgi:hypothetical protein
MYLLLLLGGGALESGDELSKHLLALLVRLSRYEHVLHRATTSKEFKGR